MNGPSAFNAPSLTDNLPRHHARHRRAGFGRVAWAVGCLLTACAIPSRAGAVESLDEDEAAAMQARQWEETAEGKLVPPKLLSYGKNPVYPKELVEENVQGIVVLRWVIGTQGTVEKVQVVSSPDPRLSQVCIEAIGRMSVLPATRNGVPVRMLVQQRFNFELPPAERADPEPRPPVAL